ncbi:MAG: diguanylate cyclase [Hyphococcus sp.]|nr:MAG: diguanylate cyclase [Marinicaulis sp.]
MASSKPPSEVTTLPRNATAPRRRIFVRGLELDAYIGVYDSEQGAPQPLIIDLDVEVIEPSEPVGDRLEDVVCYNKLTQGVKAIIAEGHIKLVETLAERIADLALSNPMAISVRVRIEKPRAIPEASAAGVELERTKR